MGPHEKENKAQDEAYAILARSKDGDSSILKSLQKAWFNAGNTVQDLLGLISRDVRWARLK